MTDTCSVKIVMGMRKTMQPHPFCIEKVNSGYFPEYSPDCKHDIIICMEVHIAS